MKFSDTKVGDRIRVLVDGSVLNCEVVYRAGIKLARKVGSFETISIPYTDNIEVLKHFPVFEDRENFNIDELEIL